MRTVELRCSGHRTVQLSLGDDEGMSEEHPVDAFSLGSFCLTEKAI